MSKQQNWFFTFDSVDAVQVEVLRHHLAELDCRYYVFAEHEGPTGPLLRGYVVMNQDVREPHMRRRCPVATWIPSSIGSSCQARTSIVDGATSVVEHGCVPRRGRLALLCNVIE